MKLLSFLLKRKNIACVANALNLYKGFRRVRGPAATQAKKIQEQKKKSLLVA